MAHACALAHHPHAQGVLDAEKSALIDKLAGRVGDMQREISDVRALIGRMAAEGALSRHPAMNSTISDIRARCVAISAS